MDVTKQGVIVLLKSAVTAQALPLPEGFHMDAALPLVRRHHMSTLIYDGAVRCGISRTELVMQTMFQGYCRALQISEGQMAQYQQICSAFDEAQVDYMPLKGCRMKALYPKPELRIMGDADILIRMEQYEKIRPIMLELGFEELGETDHEMIWQKPELYVELHKRFMSTLNPDMYNYFGDGWRRARIEERTRYGMSAEDEFVHLFAHFAKHYRAGGIGCRHVVDLWVYRRANPDLDEGYVQAELEKLQLLEFYRNMLRLIDFWFRDGDGDAMLEFMTEYIMAAGSWGDLSDRVIAETLREAKHWHTGGKAAYIRRKMFPSAAVLKSKYTILKKAPWMLPVVWLVRPFYKVLFERKSLDRPKKELKMMDEKTLRQRQKMLEYVGLVYRF